MVISWTERCLGLGGARKPCGITRCGRVGDTGELGGEYMAVVGNVGWCSQSNVLAFIGFHEAKEVSFSGSLYVTTTVNIAAQLSRFRPPLLL